MVFDVLSKLKQSGRLKNCVITISDKDAARDKKYVYGRDVLGINRSFVTFKGGETGYEELVAPLEKVLEIRVNGKSVWKRKKQIKRIYPRK